MANEADRVRKKLRERGYEVLKPTGRGKASHKVIDPKNGKLIGRIPVSPKYGIWEKNLMAAIDRYERTGSPVRSDRLNTES